jgi:hypothetical protein
MMSSSVIPVFWLISIRSNKHVNEVKRHNKGSQCLHTENCGKSTQQNVVNEIDTQRDILNSAQVISPLSFNVTCEFR